MERIAIQGVRCYDKDTYSPRLFHSGGKRVVLTGLEMAQLEARLVMARYRVLIEQDEDGMFVAECPSLPGCISQGRTRDEVLTNIKDAIAGYLESLRKHGEPIPPPIWEETVEVPT